MFAIIVGAVCVIVLLRILCTDLSILDMFIVLCVAVFLAAYL